jgi:excisionase family DNA binding protein
MTKHQPLERLLTVNDAAELLNLSVKTVWRRIDQRELHAIKDGRIVRISPEAIRNYIARHRVE